MQCLPCRRSQKHYFFFLWINVFARVYKKSCRKMTTLMQGSAIKVVCRYLQGNFRVLSSWQTQPRLDYFFKTSLTPQVCILLKCLYYARNVSTHVFVCYAVYFNFVSTIFRLEFETVMIALYFVSVRIYFL